MEDSRKVPQETKNRATIWSNNPIPGHISKQNFKSKRYMNPYVPSSTICDSQDMKTTEVSIDRWMNKDVRYTYACMCVYMHMYVHNHRPDGVLLSH